MKKIGTILLMLLSIPASAVYVNQNGLGEVMLVPYYTVNNNMNTLVSVTNTTANSKAIKINVREGLNGSAVLSYNVYLSAFDTWTFAFVPGVSTITSFAGDESVRHITVDESCAPFLDSQGQEFLPYALFEGPQDLSRSREGYIEIIEMGELAGEFVAAADHGTVGIPADCNAFEVAWVSGIWENPTDGDPARDLNPVSGGLIAQADIINVADGINFSIPVMALDDFFADDTIAHTEPGDIDLSLDAAEPKALVFSNSKAYHLLFENGIDAVSAVMMATELINTYALDVIVASKSETVFSQPTRRFYSDVDSDDALPPYNANKSSPFCAVDEYGGADYDLVIYDRESQSEPFLGCGFNKVSPCPPVQRKPAICGAVAVHSIVLPGVDFMPPSITQSKNFSQNQAPSIAYTESGFVNTRFYDTQALTGKTVNTDQTVNIMGLPVIGVTLQQYTNAGAAEGLLAQYGAAYKVAAKTEVIEQTLKNN